MGSSVLVVVAAAGLTSSALALDLANATLSLLPQEEAQPAAEEAPPGPPSEAETPFSKGWSGGIELGLNGATGNTEMLNFRGSAGARRTTDRYDTMGDITYTYSTDDGDESANRLEANARNDWLIPDSKWLFFADAKYEYDEFTDYDSRLSGHVGAGYRFIKTEKDDLLGRVGVGAYKEWGGSDDDLTPEGVLGADYTHIFSELSSFTATVDFYPQLDEIGPYRFVGRAAYQVILDQETNLIFKIGAEDRYDSTPGDGFKRNDFTYFAMLGWKF
jgi:putative salt-induced outer membrane protein YdiY